MRILQINDNDLPGRRFNGYDLNCYLRDFGYSVSQAVMVKQSQDENVHLITHDLAFRSQIIELERRYALHNVLNPYGKLLQEQPYFQAADIVHYHLVHNHLLSLLDMPELFAAKPSVWTWHDPWAVTGHCIHPKDCQGWKTGCAPCPHPEEQFSLRRDTAGALWEMKLRAYRQMDADIVVSSDFMLSFARNSPLGQCFPRVHKIPFGIQTEDFGTHSREQARETLGIPRECFVIAYRCETNPYKGTGYIYSALKRFRERKSITLLSIGNSEPPSSVQRAFSSIHLGWQNDPQVLADFYSACDVFLMPSIAESFGLMAVEAMASCRPVICFEGTALPAVTHAPDCGIAVPKGDDAALYEAILRLMRNPEEARSRGERGKALTEKEYRFADYVRRHEELYLDVLERRNRIGSENRVL